MGSFFRALPFPPPSAPQWAAVDPRNCAVNVTGPKRTADWGSKHCNERPLAVRAARHSDDRRTVTLDLLEIAPTWCMEIGYSLQGADGTPVQANIHNTVHRLGN